MRCSSLEAVGLVYQEYDERTKDKPGIYTHLYFNDRKIDRDYSLLGCQRIVF